MTATPPANAEDGPRAEHVYVLFASQTGNAEHAAKELASQVPTRLSPSALVQHAGLSENEARRIRVTATCMQLDDFLEIEQCKWTRLVVIVTSSYGVGQAPLGGYRFRDLCDAWLEQQQQQQQQADGGGNTKKSGTERGVLEGVRYALCGLGDSKYTTFFRNPTVIDEALQAVGAKRVGVVGKADASGVGENVQSAVIERWMGGVWKDLASVVAEPPLPDDRLRRMQVDTIDLCCRINPEFPRPGTGKEKGALSTAILAFLVALIAALVGYYLYQS
jgi:sulfite reductase alpha subunit-like flavoprotein